MTDDTEFNPADYNHHTLKYTWGKNVGDEDWLPCEAPLGNFIEQLFRPEVGEKDGGGIVLGKMVRGPRVKASVIEMTMAGFDNDNATPLAEIDAGLTKFDFCAARYTTHSHMSTVTEIKRDELIRHFGPDRDVECTESVRAYLAGKRNWHHSILPSVEYLKTEHKTEGIMVVVKHDPIPKCRVLVFLAKPFETAKEGRTQAEAALKWAKLLKALAAKLGLTYDPACIAPHHPFYLPRHGKGRPFSAKAFNGPLFDWTTLETDSLEDLLAERMKDKGKKSITTAGQALGKWAHTYGDRFLLADVIDHHVHDRVRGSASFGGWNIECPFDDGHTKAGDPSDTACFVANAGEGEGKALFICSCRHASCRDYTNLDMLGKMLDGEWFPRELIESSDYNIAVLDGVPLPDENDEAETEQGPGSGPDGPTAGVSPAFAAVQALIDALANPFTMTDVQAVLRSAANAPLSPLEREFAVENLAAKTGFDEKSLKRELKFIEAANEGAVSDGPGKREDSQEAKKALERLRDKVTKIIGMPLHYPPNLGTITLNIHEARPYLFKETKETTKLLCTPIAIVGGVKFADREQDRGLRVKFLNAENDCVVMDIPSQLLANKSGVDVIAKLRSGGWAGGHDGELFALEYLKLAQPTAITVYDTGGWKEKGYLFLTGECIPANAGLELSTRLKLPGAANAGSLAGAKAATSKLFANEKLVPLQAGFLAGLGGIITGAAKDSTLVCSFEGPTSKGKTTAEMFGLGHFGDPRLTRKADKIGGLLFDAHVTMNSLEEILMRCSGGAVGLDEFGKLGAKAGQEAVFMAHSGTGKQRMTEKIVARPTAGWVGGTVLISAEVGFAQRLAQEGVVQTGGLTVRALPIFVGEENEVTADEWKPVKALLDNYGHIGPAFVTAMIREDWTPVKIADRIEALLDELSDTDDAQKRRAARTVAYIWLAGEIAQKAGIIPATFKPSVLAEYLWASFLASDLAPVAPAKKAVQTLLSWLVHSRGGEVQKNDGENHYQEAMAYFGMLTTVWTKDGKEKTNVPIYAIRADKIAEKAGAAVTKRDLLLELEAQGYLVRSPKTKTQRTWNGIPGSGLGKSGQFVVLRQDEID